MFADWTDRIAAGELPFAKPQRPQGIERNVVVTLWDWAARPAICMTWSRPTGAIRASTPTARCTARPRIRTDFVPVLDPMTNTASEVLHPVRDPEHAVVEDRTRWRRRPYWGPDPIWDSKTLNHNPMFDEKGRVWFTVAHPSERQSGLLQAGFGASVGQGYSRSTAAAATCRSTIRQPGKFTLIHTCFPTHHLNFASDANQYAVDQRGVVGPGVLGWFNRKMYEETGDEVKSQGWTPFVLDTNGNGRRDEYAEPNQPLDPAKDKRLA